MADETLVPDDLLLKTFALDEANGGNQVILAHKQLDNVDHLVFTHGDQENAKLKCFKLSHLDGENYRVTEYVSPDKIAEAARMIGMNNLQQ